MQVKFSKFNDMKNNHDNYGPRNQGAETKGFRIAQNEVFLSRFKGKPSRQRKQETAFRALRKEARENKRYQG